MYRMYKCLKLEIEFPFEQQRSNFLLSIDCAPKKRENQLRCVEEAEEKNKIGHREEEEKVIFNREKPVDLLFLSFSLVNLIFSTCMPFI